MTIDFQCERCGQAYLVDDDKAGLKLRCQICAAITPIPTRPTGVVNGLNGSGDDSFDEIYSEPRVHRPANLSRSGRSKSSAKKKKSNGSLVAFGATAAALAVVLTGTFIAFRALRNSGDQSAEVKSPEGSVPPKTRSAKRNATQGTKTAANETANPTATEPETSVVTPAAPSGRLKQIGLAFRAYHDTNGTLPMNASLGPSGNPLLSWRVHLLPFLGEKRLHSQFHLDEPWDSSHNSTLISRMPDVYESSGVEGSGKTRILVFTGRNMLFNKEGPAKLADIADGISTTLLAVEVAPIKAVEWTKPADLEFKGFLSRGELGIKYNVAAGIQALMADGNVIVLSDSVPPKTFQSLITYKGNDGTPELLENIVSGTPPAGLEKPAAPPEQSPPAP
jgi:hypothetical protein